MKQITLLTTTLLFALVIVACNSDSAGPSAALIGNLNGVVTLNDQYGTELADNSGVTVTIEGTAHTATTDTDGFWRIENLKAGTYVLAYTKNGFGSTKTFGYQFVGGGEGYHNTRMAQLPTFAVTSLNYKIEVRYDSTKSYNQQDSAQIVAIDTIHTILLPGNVDQSAPAGHSQNCAVFFSTTLSQPLSRIPGEYATALPYSIAYPSTTFVLSINAKQLRDAGISSGTTAYAQAFPRQNSTYYDYSIRQHVHNLPDGGSNIVSFVMP